MNRYVWLFLILCLVSNGLWIFKSEFPPNQTIKATKEAKAAEAAHQRTEPSLKELEEKNQARKLANSWIETSATEKIKTALEGDDPVQVYAALLALPEIRNRNEDKAALRELVLAQLQNTNPWKRIAAFYALANTSPQNSDLEFVFELAKDTAAPIRHAAGNLISIFSKQSIQGKAADAVMRLLDPSDPQTVRETLRGIWGAKLSAQVEAKMIELTQHPATREDAIYFGISTLREKSASSVEELIRELSDPNPEISQRASWGLGHGIPRELHNKVAKEFLKLFELRADVQIRLDCVRKLQLYAQENQLSEIEQLAANSQLDEKIQKELRAAMMAIRTRFSQ